MFLRTPLHSYCGTLCTRRERSKYCVTYFNMELHFHQRLSETATEYTMQMDCHQRAFNADITSQNWREKKNQVGISSQDRKTFQAHISSEHQKYFFRFISGWINGCSWNKPQSCDRLKYCVAFSSESCKKVAKEDKCGCKIPNKKYHNLCVFAENTPLPLFTCLVSLINKLRSLEATTC